MNTSPVRRANYGVTVAVRLTPKAKADRIIGIATQADGAIVLKASVTAVPERGKANAALVAMLAKAWRVPKSALSIAAGATNRRKQVAVAGDPDTLHQLLDDWMAKHHG